MATFNPPDDVLRKLVAGSRAVSDISNDDIESALSDATMKNTLSDDQVSRVLGKVNRLIAAVGKNNIETVRADYTGLLAKYEELINAAATLETVPPEGLADRIIQAADQWRSLDDDDTAACQTAARLLAKLHQNDTAWDYQITPLAENSGESTPWINLARQLTTDKSFILADMAWSRAFEFESSNPEILLEHAKMQMESKSKDAAKALQQRIESGSWQPRFQSTVQEARQVLQSM